MSPWPPEGEPEGKGTKPVTLPRPGHADLAGVQKYGLADVRDALERASARHTAVHVAAGAVAKALLREIGIEVAARRCRRQAPIPPRSTRRARIRDTLGGRVEVRATRRPAGARLVRAQGGPPRRAARRGGDGNPGGEGRRDRRRLRARRAARLGGARRDRHRQAPHVEPRRRDRGRRLERRGDRRPRRDEAAADADAAARAPSTSTTGEPADALVERSDVSAVEALAVVAEAAVAWELARAAREKFGGDALGDFVAAWRAYLERTLKHVAIVGFMGAGKSTRRRARSAAVDTDDARSRRRPGKTIAEALRATRARRRSAMLEERGRSSLALGGGAVDVAARARGARATR